MAGDDRSMWWIPALGVLAVAAGWMAMSGVDTGPEVPDRVVKAPEVPDVEPVPEPVAPPPEPVVAAPAATSGGPASRDPGKVRDELSHMGRPDLRPPDVSHINAPEAPEVVARRVERMSQRYFRGMDRMREKYRWDDGLYADVTGVLERNEAEMLALQAAVEDGSMRAGEALMEMEQLRLDAAGEVMGMLDDKQGEEVKAIIGDPTPREQSADAGWWDGIPFEEWASHEAALQQGN